MKAILNFRFVLICIGVCFCSLNMYGQWDNWDEYEGHTDKEEHNYSKCVYLGRTLSGNEEGFQILARKVSTSILYLPIFQVSARGRMALGSVRGTDNIYLDFAQQDEKYGSINTYKEDFHVDAVRKLWLSSRGKTSMIADGDNFDIFGNLNITLPGLTPNAKVSIYNGVNNDPTFACNRNNKWLRIGNDGGLALYGDSTYNESKAAPTMKLIKDEVNINGDLRLENKNVKTYLGANADNEEGWVGTTSNHGLYLGTNNHWTMYLEPAGRVYIGLGKNQATAIRSELKEKYKLFVSKGILAEDYSIAPINSWSDYVFNKSYNLKKLADVEEFIKKNNHLPDVPSAAEVAEKGYSQHEMNKVLLKKIEELTLYTIEQDKKIEKLQGELDAIN